METRRRQYRTALETKAAELVRTLRKRWLIAIETTPDASEEIVASAQRDLAVSTFDRNTRLLREVKAALARIEHGGYGVCEVCEEDITLKRLDAVPWTRYCVRCQEDIDRGPTPAGARFGWRLSAAA